MTRYRIENATTGESLGEYAADDEESAIRAMVEDTSCTDEIGNDVRAVEVVSLGPWTGTLEAATYYMDDEIRERLQAGLSCRDQEWLDTYCREHERAFGENFVIP